MAASRDRMMIAIDDSFAAPGSQAAAGGSGAHSRQLGVRADRHSGLALVSELGELQLSPSTVTAWSMLVQRGKVERGGSG